MIESSKVINAWYVLNVYCLVKIQGDSSRRAFVSRSASILVVGQKSGLMRPHKCVVCNVQMLDT